MPLTPKPPRPRVSPPGELIPSGVPSAVPPRPLPMPGPALPLPFCICCQRAWSSLDWASPPLVLPFTSNASSASPPKLAAARSGEAALAAASASDCCPASVALTCACWKPDPGCGPEPAAGFRADALLGEPSRVRSAAGGALEAAVVLEAGPFLGAVDSPRRGISSVQSLEPGSL